MWGAVWLVVAPQGSLASFAERGWTDVTWPGPVLTDDYPDITRVLRL